MGDVLRPDGSRRRPPVRRRPARRHGRPVPATTTGFVGTLCPDMKLTLERPDPDFVTPVTRSADLRLVLDLVDRAEVRIAAAAWSGRVNTVTARADRVDVDGLLIRPDSCVAWALPTGQDLDATTVVRALNTWFGQPA
ncbi:aromatic-ring hydroxylase C-terminal domain-containing protein [Streptomyces justiciae]|uniref:aromatic-ring hydroxylase C-terminal domain-containing protein n=1 Tax=Streptomyces justiciae TaxID=2780140 RepID=UPI003908AF2C